MSAVFLKAEWKNLIMANYAIDPSALKPFLPRYTELDVFEDTHFVSLVGFLFANTRVLGVPIPFHQTFEEVNLRFYVRYKENNTWKRGVVFLKELVPRRAISLVANTLYGENYRTLPMRHSWKEDTNSKEVTYEWNVKNNWNYLKVEAEKEAHLLEEHTAEAFITEHYWGYTFVNDGCTGTYEVQHPRWPVHKVNKFEVNCSAAYLYGASFAEALEVKPVSVFLAQGSAVQVRKGTKIYCHSDQ